MDTKGEVQKNSPDILDPAFEARVMHNIDILEKVEDLSKDDIYKMKHGRRLKLAGVVSVFELILSLVAISVFVIGAAFSIELAAEALKVDEAAAAFQIYSAIVLMALNALLELAICIYAFRASKDATKAKAFTILAEIQAAISGVQIVWGIAQGNVRGISDVVGYVVTILLNFYFVYIGLQAQRTTLYDSDQQARLIAFEELSKERRKLGWMRLFQAYYALSVVSTIAILSFATRDQLVIGGSEIISFVVLSFNCVCFYLLWRRLRIAKPVIIALSIANIAIRAAQMFLGGQFQGESFPISFIAFAIASLFDVLSILYFTFSKRVPEVLDGELSNRTNSEAIEGEYIATSGWPKWRNLILYYCVFSVLGHWMELAFCMLIRMGVVAGEYDPSNTMLWRDFLYPFPMEGMAVVLCALLLYPFKNWLVRAIKIPVAPYLISFVVNALMCTLIELGGGLMFNANHELWDYSNMFMNFMGQVCLQNAIGFGIACSLIAWVVYPALERFIAKLPDDLMQVVFVGAMTFNIMLQALYLLEPASLAQNLSGIFGTL